MTFYFDTNHPNKLVEALKQVYTLERGQPNSFKIYSSVEYDSVPPGSVFFIVDIEKRGLELNTRKIAAEGNTVFALKFPSGKRYVPFEVAESVLKIWGRVLKFINADSGGRIYKYNWEKDNLNMVKDPF